MSMRVFTDFALPWSHFFYYGKPWNGKKYWKYEYFLPFDMNNFLPLLEVWFFQQCLSKYHFLSTLRVQLCQSLSNGKTISHLQRNVLFSHFKFSYDRKKCILCIECSTWPVTCNKYAVMLFLRGILPKQQKQKHCNTLKCSVIVNETGCQPFNPFSNILMS